MDDANHNQQLALAAAHCQQLGQRFTAQRQSVYRLLLAQPEPMSAYQLLDLAKAGELPGAQPPTIYRALEFLISVGLVHRLASTNRYLACQHPDHPHHGGGQFLVCDGCGHVDETELAAPALAAVQDLAANHHFHLSSQPLEIHGLCAHCQPQGGEDNG